jgi:hypothetical protein
VVWDNFLKGRICTEWCTYIKHHLASNNIKKDDQEWGKKLILALWEHIYRVWTLGMGSALQIRGYFKTNGHHLAKERRIEGSVA